MFSGAEVRRKDPLALNCAAFQTWKWKGPSYLCNHLAELVA